MSRRSLPEAFARGGPVVGESRGGFGGIRRRSTRSPSWQGPPITRRKTVHDPWPSRRVRPRHSTVDIITYPTVRSYISYLDVELAATQRPSTGSAIESP